MATDGGIMRTEYVARAEMMHLLAALMPYNRLALEVSLYTGLRISDVLSLRTESIMNIGKNRRITIREAKTGKNRRVYIPAELLERMQRMSGKLFVFPHRTKIDKHRTRQAIFKDLKRVARIFRLKENIAPHSCRKIYAVDYFHKCGDIKKVQANMNHSDEAITMLYALADELTRRKLENKKA